MSLWTPYTQDAPLDLSNPRVKVEPVSPITASSAPSYPSHPAGSSTGCSYPSHSAAQYYETYPCQPVTNVVPSTMSPDSIRSWAHSRPIEPSPSEESQETYDSSSLLDDVEYQAFERNFLQEMAGRNGGNLLGSNPNMRRAVQTSRTADDDAYRKQRERNNKAAKQSRIKRNLREIRLASQVSFLQKKVFALKAQLAVGVCGRCRSIQ